MNEVTDRETGREIVGWVGGQCGREKRGRRCGLCLQSQFFDSSNA